MKLLTRNACFLFARKIDSRAYGTLELQKGASEEEVKSAYYRLAKQYHPDVNPEFTEKFKEINEAYTLLKDPETVRRPSPRKQS